MHVLMSFVDYNPVPQSRFSSLCLPRCPSLFVSVLSSASLLMCRPPPPPPAPCVFVLASVEGWSECGGGICIDGCCCLHLSLISFISPLLPFLSMDPQPPYPWSQLKYDFVLPRLKARLKVLHGPPDVLICSRRISISLPLCFPHSHCSLQNQGI